MCTKSSPFPGKSMAIQTLSHKKKRTFLFTDILPVGWSATNLIFIFQLPCLWSSPRYFFYAILSFHFCSKTKSKSDFYPIWEDPLSWRNFGTCNSCSFCPFRWKDRNSFLWSYLELPLLASEFSWRLSFLMMKVAGTLRLWEILRSYQEAIYGLL
jgi:hypothetical protein